MTVVYNFIKTILRSFYLYEKPVLPPYCLPFFTIRFLPLTADFVGTGVVVFVVAVVVVVVTLLAVVDDVT